jgi:ribosomal protein S17
MSTTEFLSVENIKICITILDKYMQDKYAFSISTDGKKTNVKKLLYDIMTEVEKQHGNVKSLKDKNNITLNIARDYFISNYKLRGKPAAKPNLLPLERDNDTYGSRLVISDQIKPESTVKRSVDNEFEKVMSMRKQEATPSIPNFADVNKPIEDMAYNPDDFMRKLSELEQNRGLLNDLANDRLSQDIGINQKIEDVSPKALYEAQEKVLSSTKETFQNMDTMVVMPKQDFLPPPNVKTILIDKFLSINGFDRDWTVDTARFNFRIDFAQKDNSVLQRYRNIKTIAATKVIIPMEIEEVQSLVNIPKPFYNYTFSFSYPYLLLRIDEISDVYDGTNENVRRTFCKLVFDKCYKAPNGRGYLVLTPMQHEMKTFHPTPLASLSQWTISIRRPNGMLLNESRDKNQVFKVEYEQYNKHYLKIVTKFFHDKNEFYKGDTVLIKGYGITKEVSTMSDDAIAKLNAFICRPEGHEVLEMGQANDSGYYRNFYINGPGVFDDTIGRFVIDSVMIDNLNAYNDTVDFQQFTGNNGDIINMSLQVSMAFKLQTLVSDPGVIDVGLA